MKILINGPSRKLKSQGGVANHIWGLKNYWSERVSYNAVGNRDPKRPGRGKWWLPWDIVKFAAKLLIYRPDFVWINPSISSNALRRDFIFLNIAHRFGKKVAVFIHGFDLNNFEKLNKQWLADNLNKASFIMVLAGDFRKRLQNIGVKVPIELTTTKVEDSLLEGFNPYEKDYFTTNTLLFLARVEKAKGIYETIDTFALLKKDYPNLKLQISGIGSELEACKEYVAKKKITDIIFTGVLTGTDVAEAYRNALLLLLTSHGEGMPTNVLEAMSFGLPVVTRPVGGLSDFFEDGKMGVISDTLSPGVFAEETKPIIEDRRKAREIGLFNGKYAAKRFRASSVAKQLESYFKKHNR